MPNTRRTLALSAFVSVACVIPFSNVFAGPQQERMANCSSEAKEKSLKGDERKAFMKSCLSSGKPAATQTAEDAAAADRKKQCRSDAKDKALKGSERKAFISDCLKA